LLIAGIDSNGMTSMKMDIQEVQNYLPHRYPFLLIDRVLELIPGKSLVAIKNVTINEEYFTGHFPNQPVMPGVLIIEAMAQAAGILAFRSENVKPDENSSYYLVGIDKARFKRLVVPGDQIVVTVSIIKEKRGIWVFDCKAKVDGETTVAAQLMCTVKEHS